MSSAIYTPGQRPDAWGMVGDHARRISALEANPAQSSRRLIVNWAGSVATIAPLTGATWPIPYDPEDGSAFAFTLNEILLRIEQPALSSVQVRVEKSPGGNMAFVATTVGTVTVSMGNYESIDVVSSAIGSGDLIRIVFVAVPGIAGISFEIQVSGKES